ncbi:MAG: CPBP family intramembrane metalloprotease [Ruminococcaceae bacterium]|nr:CPBP family intramembrane metalloprotease [Oscillospiraceae bacterium]
MKLKPYTAAPFLAIFVYLLTLCAERIIGGLDMDVNSYLLTLGAVQIATYALPMLLYGLLFGGIDIKRMRFALPTAKSVPTQILLAVILLLGSALISMLGVRVGFSAPQNGVAEGIGAPSVLVLLIFAVMPAICEEIVFRGVIMSSFEPCGVTTAIVGTSILFAAAHMSLENLPLYFFASVVLCAVTYVSRSLISAIVLHSIYNICVLTLSGYLSSVAAHLESFSLLFIVMLFLLWIFIIVALTEGERVYRSYAQRNLDSSYTPAKLSPQSKLKAKAAVYFSPAFLLAVLIYIAVIVFSMQDIA